MTVLRDFDDEMPYLDRRNAKRREKYARDHPRKKVICIHQLGDAASSIYGDASPPDTLPDDRRNQRNARRRELYAIQGKRTDTIAVKQAGMRSFNNPDLNLSQDGNQFLEVDICATKEAMTDIGDCRNAKRREKYALDKLRKRVSDPGNDHQTVLAKSYDIIQERRREKYASRRDANSLVNARRREKYAARNNAIVIYPH
jgi:hypothetical protein